MYIYTIYIYIYINNNNDDNDYSSLGHQERRQVLVNDFLQVEGEPLSAARETKNLIAGRNRFGSNRFGSVVFGKLIGSVRFGNCFFPVRRGSACETETPSSPME